ncbi:hypothetical protein PS1_042858 [Malus domestica]
MSLIIFQHSSIEHSSPKLRSTFVQFICLNRHVLINVVDGESVFEIFEGICRVDPFSVELNELFEVYEVVSVGIDLGDHAV